jgi:hypothetical protein
MLITRFLKRLKLRGVRSKTRVATKAYMSYDEGETRCFNKEILKF